MSISGYKICKCGNDQREHPAENGDLERGDVGRIQESTQRLLKYVRDDHYNHTKRISPSIYMVPRTLRDLSPSSFSPRVVSIGPLHKEDKNVKAFEEHKRFFLASLMSRISSAEEEILEEEILKSCMEKVYYSMEQIRRCYDLMDVKTYEDAEIAEMIVMDACFILEFICQIPDLKFYLGGTLLPEDVFHDLVSLENQIPFFILDEIFQCTVLKLKPQGGSLIEFIRPLLKIYSIFDEDMKIGNISIDTTTTSHILSVLHECYKPQEYIISPLSDRSVIPSSVDLERAGVTFKPNPDEKWMLEMDVKLRRFPNCFGSWNKPTLTMPVLDVHERTEYILKNLIAYEQSCQTCTQNHIVSYVDAMDMLVNTQEDVAMLIDSGVLVNNLGSNEEAANMINSFCKQVILTDFSYAKQWKTLNDYYNGYWPKHVAWLRRKYFNNPWNIIALFAGIILFSVAVVQTIFTIKS